jgi:hypothetical protein
MNHKAYKAQKDFQGAKTTNYELRTKDYGLRTPLVRGVGQMAEQVLAKFADDELFCAESLVIENKQGHLVPFIWNPAQSKLDAAIRKQQADGLPVRLLILKSRRSGFSTGVAGKLFKQTAFYDGQKALVVAHEKEPATNIFTMYAIPDRDWSIKTVRRFKLLRQTIWKAVALSIFAESTCRNSLSIAMPEL